MRPSFGDSREQEVANANFIAGDIASISSDFVFFVFCDGAFDRCLNKAGIVFIVKRVFWSVCLFEMWLYASYCSFLQ